MNRAELETLWNNDQFMTVKQVAEYQHLSSAYLYAATKRRNHPLPCINCGSSKRPHVLVRPSVFEKWICEEMGIDEVDARAGRDLAGVR